MIGGIYGAMASVMAQYVDPEYLGLLGGGVQLVSFIVNLTVSAYVTGGILSFCLKVSRGQRPNFGEVFAGGPYFGRMFVALICTFVATTLGCFCLVVPGIIIGLGTSMYAFCVVDQGLSGIDALKKSWEMTKGQRGGIFVFGLLAVLVVIAGYIACIIGAILGSLPILYVAWTYVYLRLRGEQPRLATG